MAFGRLAWTVAPSLLSLPAASVHIWKALLNDSAAQAVIRSSLPLEEQRSRKSLTSRTSRAILRDVLSRYTETTPSQLTLSSNDYGKPSVLCTSFKLEFNVSHTNDIVVIVVSDVPVGVDIERKDRQLTNMNRLLKRFTKPEEYAVRNAKDVQQSFLKLWTRKEAFLKCTGEGIRRGLTSFEVTLDRDENWLRHVDGKEAEAEYYWTISLEINDPKNRHMPHVGSLVCNGESQETTKYLWRPR